MGVEIKVEPKPGETLTVNDSNRMGILRSMLPYAGLTFSEEQHGDGSITYRLDEVDEDDE